MIPMPNYYHPIKLRYPAEKVLEQDEAGREAAVQAKEIKALDFQYPYCLHQLLGPDNPV